MCGIAGLLEFVGQADPQPVRSMLARMAHRGPDDEGCEALGPAVLGMRRLSILDPTPRGHQPMRSADGSQWLVYNGEIYNFLELAAELADRGHRFETGTDTEVILAAYAEWGVECVARFNGIWAFALWDVARERMVLSRDRVGVKPLFVARGSGRLAFASEIKGLRVLDWVRSDPEPRAVKEFLLDGLVDHGEPTFFQGVERLPAGHTLVIEHGVETLSRYWQQPALAEDSSTRADPADSKRIANLRDLLVDAVALELRSDVRLGSCLSGGIDSSAIVSMAAALRRGELHPRWSSRRDRDAVPQLAFFAEFREAGIDERPFVDAVVAATGVTLETTTPNVADVLATLSDVLDAQDEPFGSSSILAQYFVMRRAHESQVKVLLDGQGADEILAGYPPYRAMRAAGSLRSGDPRSVRGAIRAVIAGSVPRLPTLGHVVLGGGPLPARLRRQRMPEAWLGKVTRRASAFRHVEDDQPNATPLARNLWRQIVSENLPALLRFEDRNSMAFSIEARVPYLDHRVIEAGLALPDRLKIAGGEQKVALRRAMRGIVPPAVIDRRDKIAFRTPQARWLTEALPAIRTAATEPRIEAAGFVAHGAFAQAVDGFAEGRVSDTFVWRLLNLEQWLRGLEAGPRHPAP